MASANRIREVFDGALDRAGEARRAFLDGACAGDAPLRAKVDALIGAAENEDAFLSEPTVGAEVADGAMTIAASASEGPGTRIGPYKLLQQIGEGGFGVVFMAEQEKPVARRVALKIIKLGMDTRQVVARFEQERQALAMMDHPNIAKVFDAGATDTGRPYFVMELVKGDLITAYCDTHNLSIEDRLGLFEQVCHAVQHAHTKGIIHRDIKPSNVLVTVADSKPIPKVIDFGIAKATLSKLTEKTLFTEHRALIGTPEYMSPEQAEMTSLDIDTRSDIYSLGVLLYELLTGALPFDAKRLRSAAFNEIQRIIREEEPPNPSTRLSTLDTLANVASHRHTEPARLSRQIRGDLDWIVMKALEKDRTRRYETANGLAMDVQRHLAGEPVVAAPPSAGYKLRKFVKRNRARVIAGGLVAGALVLGVIGTTTGMVWALDEKDRADGEAAKATASAVSEAAAKVQAQENERNAIAEAKRAETITEFVTTALKASDAQNDGTAGSGGPGGVAGAATAGAGYDITILEAMDNAVMDIDSGRFKDDPKTEADLRNTIGIILHHNGKFDKAKLLLEQALAMRERLFNGDDPIVADSLLNLAEVYGAQDQYAQAELLYTRALSIYEKALGPDHQSVANVLNALAVLFSNRAHFAKAEPLFMRSLAISEKALGPDHTDVATTLNNLAVFYTDQGQNAKAEPLYTRALAIQEKALGPDHLLVASSLSNLAGILQGPGQRAQAESFHTRSLAIREKAYGPEHPQVATSLNNLAGHYYERDQPAQAEPLYTRALAIFEKSLGPDHPSVLLTKGNLAGVYWSQGKLDKSVPLFEEVLKASEARIGRQHPDTLRTLANLGVNYWDAGRLAEAIPLLEEAYRASKQFPQLRFAGPVLLNAYGKAADPNKPESTARVVALVQELLAAARATLPKDSLQLAEQLVILSQALLMQKAWDEAEALLREVLTTREKAQADRWTTFNARSLLGEALLGQNKLVEAEPLLLDGYRGMKEREAAIPARYKVRIPETLDRLVQLYEAKGDETEAAAWRGTLEAALTEQAKPDANGGGK